jgi:hypothetical protein
MIRAELESILCGGTRSASASDVQVEVVAPGIISGAAAYSLSEKPPELAAAAKNVVFGNIETTMVVVSEEPPNA